MSPEPPSPRTLETLTGSLEGTLEGTLTGTRKARLPSEPTLDVSGVLAFTVSRRCRFFHLRVQGFGV